MMAAPTAAPHPTPSAQIVGNAFVEQYYQILNKTPGMVYRFYQDISYLSRPNKDGTLTTVTTMGAINEKILSLDHKDYTVEIKTADSQESFGKGVIVLVTGSLTDMANVRQKFSQTFFLAPQEKGYFVLNDIFRFVDEHESPCETSDLVNGVEENIPNAGVAPDPEPEPTQDPGPQTKEPEASTEVENLNGAEVVGTADKVEALVIEDKAEVPAQISENENLTGEESVPVAQEDAPKKSYASIVKVMKGTPAARPISGPATRVRVPPANTDQHSLGSAKPSDAPEASATASDSPPESSNVNEEIEGHSIYVRNLPYSATAAQLEEAFKKFGPIKPNGIQVRSNKQGSCFGFVEFETANAVQNALEAPPIVIGDLEAVVEEKRTTSRGGGGGRGRYSGRGGFRSDSFKNRGNLGGRGYGRNESRNQGEFTGRSKGSTARIGEAYQRGNQNSSGRGGRQGGNRSSGPA